MSINKIIKEKLPVTSQTLPHPNTTITHCKYTNYEYCTQCKEHKLTKCNEKLIFQSYQQVSNVRWHLFFVCGKNHKVIRWVIIDNKSVVIGNVKN
ncbi:hypothetical protein [Spiroplasma sp. AdecLV25b]|uniref:hypothetical protein n=1 Tax=Spiroplasma sp. AdecLV25b TaxID=3027162 RepID=UPI0027DFBA60|nr:hypothetical protein [Spiroplasma sp. AdecLV25b]